MTIDNTLDNDRENAYKAVYDVWDMALEQVDHNIATNNFPSGLQPAYNTFQRDMLAVARAYNDSETIKFYEDSLKKFLIRHPEFKQEGE